MDFRILKVLRVVVLVLLPTSVLESQTVLEPLLRDPSRAEWSVLSRFNETSTRGEFEQRLREVFDPFHGLDQFLQVNNDSVRVFAAPGCDQLVEVRFASSPERVKRLPVGFATVSVFSRGSASKPLAGLRVVVEPADIGGKWGDWDDRSTLYRGYGRIQEGDLNLTVAKILEHQRLRLLTKLFENVTPIETNVSVRIAARFRAVTGDPPVGYGNSANTRTVSGGNAFVVARNLAFNREHDGPVVVTEPYFMNERVTLLRLLAGDYKGVRLVGGKERESIFREYANCVAAGLVDAYAGNRTN